MSTNTIEVIDRGLNCLSEHLGEKETELFVLTLLRERFDYTEWRQSLVRRIESFDDLDAYLEETKEKAVLSGRPVREI